MVDIVFSRGIRRIRRKHSPCSCLPFGTFRNVPTSRWSNARSFLALKGQYLPAQGKRLQGATPWDRCPTHKLRPERAKALQKYVITTHTVLWFNAFALSGRQMVGTLHTQGVSSRCSPCPGLCAFGLSGRTC